MDYILIDTNIFYGNWFLQSANFTFLANYLENTGGVLLLSKVVEEEVQNKFETEFEAAQTSVLKAIKRLNTFYKKNLEFDFEDNSYDFTKILKSKVTNFSHVEYHKISNAILVSRAIKRIAPFKDGEKGFRDTLIWLSLLSYVKDNDINDNVIFITENYTDYFDKESGEFKQDLLDDIRNHDIKTEIIPFNSLQSFIASLDKEEYENADMMQKLQEIVNELESEIETDIESYINRLSSKDVQSLFDLKSLFPKIDTLLDFKLEIDEGIEDLMVLRHKKIGKKEYYISAELELRICTFIFGIPQNDYNHIKNYIDENFDNVYLAEDEFAYFEKYIRPRLTINFIIHLDSEVVTGVEVIEAEFSVK